MLRSVLYWVAKSAEYSLAGTEGGGVARIYCIGTPFVWWLAAAGPSLFAAWLMTQVSAPLRAPTAPRRAPAAPHRTPPHRRHHLHPPRPAQPLHSLRATPSVAWPTVGVGCFLALGYLLNWLPFMIVERVAFLYHFLPSLM